MLLLLGSLLPLSFSTTTDVSTMAGPPLSCTLKNSSAPPGTQGCPAGSTLFIMTMQGAEDPNDTKQCEFSADESFASKAVSVRNDQDMNCERASWAGCNTYGSAYTFNCACACDKQNPPGAKCDISWTATVCISGTARNARCNCS